MSFYGDLNFYLEVAKGNITGHTAVNKFGRSPNVDSGVATDIWDGANATDDVAIWVAPTQARTHDIVSTNASDDGSPAGVGGQMLRVYGLTDWDTPEVDEDITLNGTTNVPTTKQYVIIHRMQMLTWGSSGPNVGVITATAQTDNTVTAQIVAGAGQTQMAIYGVPSTQTLYAVQYYAGVEASGPAGSILGTVLANTYVDTQLTGFLIKHSFSRTSSTSTDPQPFQPPARIAGPCIIKIQATGTANNLQVDAGFDLILVDN